MRKINDRWWIQINGEDVILDGAVSEATVRLIETAPEMREALRSLADCRIRSANLFIRFARRALGEGK